MSQIIAYLHEFSYGTIFVRLIMALLAGGIIGLERGKHGRAAGLRTHIMVCIGSAMTALTGQYVHTVLGVSGDVLRLAAQVISGIGFLGAGMIIVKHGSVITGLTTAAGMWATAAIGIALGYGFYSGAWVATAICVFTAAFLSRLERSRKRSVRLYAEVDLSEDMGALIGQIKKEVDEEAAVEPLSPKSNVPNTIALYITVTNSSNVLETREKVASLPGVRFAMEE